MYSKTNCWHAIKVFKSPRRRFCWKTLLTSAKFCTYILNQPFEQLLLSTPPPPAPCSLFSPPPFPTAEDVKRAKVVPGMRLLIWARNIDTAFMCFPPASAVTHRHTDTQRVCHVHSSEEVIHFIGQQPPRSPHPVSLSLSLPSGVRLRVCCVCVCVVLFSFSVA